MTLFKTTSAQLNGSKNIRHRTYELEHLVVEDTMIDGIPVAPDYGPGPMSAAIDFLKTEQGANFTQDVTREAMILTFNPGGWLRKKQ